MNESGAEAKVFRCDREDNESVCHEHVVHHGTVEDTPLHKVLKRDGASPQIGILVHFILQAIKPVKHASRIRRGCVFCSSRYSSGVLQVVFATLFTWQQICGALDQVYQFVKVSLRAHPCTHEQHLPCRWTPESGLNHRVDLYCVFPKK